MSGFSLGMYGRSLSDPEAVAANRQGKATPAQLAVVASARSQIGCAIIGVTLMILGMAALILIGSALDKNNPFKSTSASDMIFYGSITAGVILATLALAFFPQQMRRSRLRRMEEEMRNGEIAQAEGRIVWNGRSYLAEVGSRRMRSIISPTQKSVMSLSPGEYHFFYLPRSGLLLSAAPLGETQQAPDTTPFPLRDASTSTPARLHPENVPDHELLTVLATVHHFRAGDLPINREGRMTGRQRFRLVRKVFLPVLISALIVGVLICLAVAARMAGRPNPSELIKAVGGMYALILIVAVSLLFLWNSYHIILDLVRGRLSRSEGVVEKDWSGGRSTTFYYLTNGLRFKVPYRAYTALVEGLRYRIYYGPHCKMILAIEPLN